MDHTTPVRAGLLAAAVMFAVAARVRAGDPGELFPDVAAYDEKVSAPVSRPEAAIKNVASFPQPLPPAPPADPPRAPDAQTNPPAANADAKPEPATTQTQTAEEPAAKANRANAAWVFHPYSVGLLNPLLDPEDQQAFDQRYAEKITHALAGKLDERRKVAAELAAAAADEKSIKLKRYLLLHSLGLSIRGASPVDERAARANSVLPLLNEETLAVAQARADCLNDLLLSAASPAESLIDANADALTTLSILQVQGGFPREAVDSLKKAREMAARCKQKSADRAAELAEAAAWVDRSSMASGMWPRWQQLLKTKPDDAFTNTQCAILHISLYGHLSHAEPFAQRSDKPELKTLATKIQSLFASDETQSEPAKVLAVCIALGDVAQKVAAHPFDKYSIAMLAGDRTAALLDDKVLSPAEQSDAKTLLAALKDLIEKGPIKPGYPPKWLGGYRTQDSTKIVLEEVHKPEDKPQPTTQEKPTNPSVPTTPTVPQVPRRRFGRWRR